MSIHSLSPNPNNNSNCCGPGLSTCPCLAGIAGIISTVVGIGIGAAGSESNNNNMMLAGFGLLGTGFALIVAVKCHLEGCCNGRTYTRQSNAANSNASSSSLLSMDRAMRQTAEYAMSYHSSATSYGTLNLNIGKPR